MKFVRFLPLFLCLLAGAQAKLPYQIKTLKDLQPKMWAISVQYPQFGGNSALAQFANRQSTLMAQNTLGNFNGEAKDLFRDLDSPPSQEYVYECTAKPSMVRSDIISFWFMNYINTLGAHPMYSFSFANYGVVRGVPKVLKLHDLFTTDPRSQVSKLVVKKLRATGRADWVMSGEVKNLTDIQLQQFVITSKGLTFMFEPYAMGSYAQGSFEIPCKWSELKNLNTRGPLAALLRK